MRALAGPCRVARWTSSCLTVVAGVKTLLPTSAQRPTTAQRQRQQSSSIQRLGAATERLHADVLAQEAQIKSLFGNMRAELASIPCLD